MHQRFAKRDHVSPELPQSMVTPRRAGVHDSIGGSSSAPTRRPTSSHGRKPVERDASQSPSPGVAPWSRAYSIPGLMRLGYCLASLRDYSRSKFSRLNCHGPDVRRPPPPVLPWRRHSDKLIHSMRKPRRYRTGLGGERAAKQVWCRLVAGIFTGRMQAPYPRAAIAWWAADRVRDPEQHGAAQMG